MAEEFFGTGDQCATLRRGRAMAELMRHDARYSYYGRTVLLATPQDGDIDQLAALCSVQGYSSYGAVPTEDVETVKFELGARGLKPMHYVKWEGADAVLEAARATVRNQPLPDDLTLVRLDAETPPGLVASLAEMCLECGVLPTCGEVLRGLLIPAVCLAAVNSAGRVVSCAASATFAHPDHPILGGQAWWGMLATDPARRGQRLALILGAKVILAMEEGFGLHNFMTGVEAGNAPSEALCARLGLAPGGYAIVGASDPAALASGRMTK